MKPPSVWTAYSGIDNLEIMREAENYNRFLTSLIGTQLRPGHRVLDFGAGTGTFALPLLGHGIDLICVEPDQVLKSRLSRLGAQVHANLDEIADGSLDFIYTLNVLEHIEDDKSIVRALGKKLKSGGKVLIYVPAFQILFSAMDRKVGHYRRYRRRDLLALLTETEFKVSSAAYVDCLGFAAALLYRIFGNDEGKINRTALRNYDRFVFPISRAFDVLLKNWVGKNVLVLGEKM
jgi:SAM-dependent methyltransferase